MSLIDFYLTYFCLSNSWSISNVQRAKRKTAVAILVPQFSYFNFHMNFSCKLSVHIYVFSVWKLKINSVIFYYMSSVYHLHVYAACHITCGGGGWVERGYLDIWVFFGVRYLIFDFYGVLYLILGGGDLIPRRSNIWYLIGFHPPTCNQKRRVPV